MQPFVAYVTAIGLYRQKAHGCCNTNLLQMFFTISKFAKEKAGENKRSKNFDKRPNRHQKFCAGVKIVAKQTRG